MRAAREAGEVLTRPVDVTIDAVPVSPGVCLTGAGSQIRS
jgi:hypothetical protein